MRTATRVGSALMISAALRKLEMQVARKDIHSRSRNAERARESRARTRQPSRQRPVMDGFELDRWGLLRSIRRNASQGVIGREDSSGQKLKKTSTVSGRGRRRQAARIAAAPRDVSMEFKEKSAVRNEELVWEGWGETSSVCE